MGAQIFCLASASGLPLFIRKKCETETLSFSHIASLNGVHLFAKSHDVTIQNTVMQDSVVCWREFSGTIMLIGIASGVSSTILSQFLESVFNAMVLSLGIDEFKSIRNPERLKRELRVCYRVVDKMLDFLESGDKVVSTKTGLNLSKSPSSGDINGYVETILCQENQSLLNNLEIFVESVESLYGCVSIHGRIAVATASWWELHAEEKKLLSILICLSNTASTSADIPVFLPYKSPSVPFRFITLRLVAGVEVSILCGPNPSLSEIETSVLQIWRPLIDLLRCAEKTYPRNFPSNILLDSNILGFLLINTKTSKFLISRNLNRKESCSLSGTHRLNVLRTFYHQSVSVFLLRQGDNMCDAAQETYWCSEYHKCHGLCSGTNVICVLYAASVPTFTMRILTKNCLKSVTTEKHLCW